MRYSIPFLWLIGLACPSWAQQAINLDLGYGGVPSSTFGGVAGQPGHWNELFQVATHPPEPMLDVHGNASGVSAWNSGNVAGVDIPDGSMTLDQQQLLGDGTHTMFQWGNLSHSVTLQGFTPGWYRVYAYCMVVSPFGTGAQSNVSISLPGPDGLQVGTDQPWTGDYIQGQTHAVWVRYISSSFSITCSNPNGWYGARLDTLSGIQVVPLPPSLGLSYCASQPNTTDSMAALVMAGSESLAANDFELGVFSLPPASWGYFLVSQDAGLTHFPGGSRGVLCLGGNIGRHNRPGELQLSDPAGVVRFAPDLADLPQGSASVAVTAGSTWRWQFWFRDAGLAFTTNFSEAQEITFVP